MALNNLCYLYSLGTDAFYNEAERDIHNQLIQLYIKKKENPQEATEVNRTIKDLKEQLTQMLNEGHTYRRLREEAITKKSVINMFSSSLTRALGIGHLALTEEIMIVNVFFFQVFEDLVKFGYEYKGDRYIFLTASAGQIRTKRAVFVKESSYNQIKDKITCGLSIDSINKAGGCNPNKYLAYLALSNSATDTWEGFDIDKAIVVEDFETGVLGEVDHIAEADYSITRETTKTLIPHMDGCGIMLDFGTRMVRLPWVKGLLVTFPFDEFIREKCDGRGVVLDIYGKEHDVLKEGIRYILTKSQFKMYKYYSSWEEYKDYFKRYQCEPCYCNLEEEVIPQSKINYQMLQTLSDMQDEEIARLVQKSNTDIDKIGNDFQATMRLLGVTEGNPNKSHFQEALVLYPELFRDVYSKEILKQTKRSLVKQAKAGKLRVNGKYLFLSPDLYAFCEWLFLGEIEPQGLLQDGEIYTNQFKNEDDLACLRSPHLYREWAVKKNKRTDETNKWFGGTKCVYTSTHDLMSRFLMFDCDGDKALVVRDRLLTTVAKRNMQGIVPLAYDLKKAKGGLLTTDSIYQGMTRAYTSGNIGPVSNNITKIWNSGEIGEEQINVVKWLCYENNAVIDCAKTMWMPTRPKAIDHIIKSYTKSQVPNFFIYAKDKLPSQVEPPNNSVMNRIAGKISIPRIKWCKTIGKFDYRVLMNSGVAFDWNDDSPIIDSYNYWNTHQFLFNNEDDNCGTDEDYMYKVARQKIIEESNAPIEVIVNTLVNYLYTVRNSSAKKMLWGCFGQEIVENIQNNVVALGNVCHVCGKRFTSQGTKNGCCSEKCALNLSPTKM